MLCSVSLKAFSQTDAFQTVYLPSRKVEMRFFIKSKAKMAILVLRFGENYFNLRLAPPAGPSNGGSGRLSVFVTCARAARKFLRGDMRLSLKMAYERVLMRAQRAIFGKFSL